MGLIPFLIVCDKAAAYIYLPVSLEVIRSKLIAMHAISHSSLSNEDLIPTLAHLPTYLLPSAAIRYVKVRKENEVRDRLQQRCF